MDEIEIQKFLRAISIRIITGAMLLGLTPIAFAAPKQEDLSIGGHTFNRS